MARSLDPTQSDAEIESIACRIIEHPALLDEVMRRLAWVDEVRLFAIAATAHQCLAHRCNLLGAVKTASFEQFVNDDGNWRRPEIANLAPAPTPAPGARPRGRPRKSAASTS